MFIISCRTVVFLAVEVLFFLTHSYSYYYTLLSFSRFSFIKEQIKLRENALAQADMLMEYKRAICHHASHMGDSDQGGLLSIFVSLLAEPLSKTGTARTDEDHLTIELVLHLFRNLLQAEPLLKTSVVNSDRAATLHDELVQLYDKELVLDILLVLSANMEQRENVPYNLLVMELLQHLLRNQDPVAVAKSAKKNADKKKARQKDPENAATATASAGSLKGHLVREKQSLGAAASLTSRHSHFGGTLQLNKAGGKRQYVSSAQLDPRRKTVQAAAAKRKNKRSDPFIGSGRTLQSHTRMDHDGGPARVRAQQTLDRFCRRFVKECYGPVMKSLKNEFRRDSVRLEDGDRVVFFRIAWFFCQWWRVSGKTVQGDETVLGQLIFTMDVFTFNLVLNATDTFQEHKKYARVSQTVALLSEMLHLLHVMYCSGESTEQIMAMGLMDRLFYGGDPLDRLPKLLSKWQPGTASREYLCDLVEVTHMTLKLLDTHAKACSDLSKTNAKEHDTVAKMKAAAADFDVSSYFMRKIVSNHTTYMYTQLLSQYHVNAEHVNHRIVAFFLRVTKVKVANPDAIDAELPQNLLATKSVTLEPMLYTVHMLTVLNAILNDASIRKEKDYATTLQFAVKIVNNFANATKANPMLFVEAMFRHPVPHRFCELATNMYVSEELRMISERELLMEEQARFETETTRQDDDDDDEDEELEFEDFAPMAPSQSMKGTKPGFKRRVLEDSDSDDEDDSKPAAKRTSAELADSDDDDSKPAAKRKSVELEDSGDEDDSEPTAKRKSAELEDSGDEEDAALAERSKKAAARTAEMQKRLKSLDEKDDASSSEDELDLDLDMEQTGATSTTKAAVRSILDDDSDDDE